VRSRNNGFFINRFTVNLLLTVLERKFSKIIQYFVEIVTTVWCVYLSTHGEVMTTVRYFAVSTVYRANE